MAMDLSPEHQMTTHSVYEALGSLTVWPTHKILCFLFLIGLQIVFSGVIMAPAISMALHIVGTVGP